MSYRHTQLAVALLLMSSAAYATSSVFTSCTAGSVTDTPCPSDSSLLTGITGPQGQLLVAAFAQATESAASNVSLFSQYPTIQNGEELSTVAETVAPSTNSSVSPLTGTANASVSDTYISSGPPRSGFLELQVQFGYLHEDAAGADTADFSDASYSYTYGGGGGINGSTAPFHCFIEDCEYVATVPFELGTEFQVAISSQSAVSSPSAMGHDAGTTVLFALVDANGAPVSFTAVPEPSTGALVLLAGGVAACFALRSRRCTKLSRG